jgi:ferric-dicitrate binding protein FerR (iron transport regulator)
MSELNRAAPGSVYHQAAAATRERPTPTRREESGSSALGWLAAGAAVAVLGYFAWQSFGPDFRRYMKIRSM